jgi:GT2 family glycosyltransferase
MQPLISIVVVTFNSLRFSKECLSSIRNQNYRRWELIVIDNNSTDGTVEFLRSSGLRNVVFNQKNTGFAAAQNQGIKLSSGEWVLALNPDVVLASTFLAELVGAVHDRDDVGTVCGKLLRWQPGTSQPFSHVIDSAGMYFRPDLRHLDRGSGVKDAGQYDRCELVFGATGAAALYRRSMIDDISIAGEFFDEHFFSYREDADIAWRAQLMGWNCLYVSPAVGWHVRRVTPEQRRELPAEINWHSAKNRFLMRIKNAGGLLWLRFFPAMLWRDAMVLGYALLRDRRLLSALVYPVRNIRAILKKREWIQERRRVKDREIVKWFRWAPTSVPISEKPSPKIVEQQAS